MQARKLVNAVIVDINGPAFNHILHHLQIAVLDSFDESFNHKLTIQFAVRTCV